MYSRIRLVYFFLLVCLFPLNAGAVERVILSLHGSNTIGAELAPKLVEHWLASQDYQGVKRKTGRANTTVVMARDGLGEQVAVEIIAHGSGTGFTNLAASRADIGLSSRRIKPNEQRMLQAHGDMTSYQSEYVLGLDGIAVIVNPNNPVRSLDKSVVRKLFSGEITDWAEVGGKPGRVRVHARNENSGTFDTFKSLVLGKNHGVAAQALRYESNEQLSDAVSRDRDAIGFVALPYINKSRALALSDGEAHAIEPQGFTVATEDYVLARRLFLYVPANAANPFARAFAEFAVSERGQEIVHASGFISQKILEGKVEARRGMPEEYMALLEGARRLSLNFRFRRGEVVPDTKAQRDIDRLAKFLSLPENRDRKVTLVGFADSDEAMPMLSLELSVLRADAIANYLIKKGITPQHVRGYGQVAPVASNDTQAGRLKNRRVEVWLE